MKSATTILSLSALFPQLLIGGTALNTLAQQSEQNVRKEHLEYCVSQLTVKVGEVEAIKGVMDQPNLLPVEKLEQVSQILTPQQKQQLRACMEQPIPPQARPLQGEQP